MTLTGDKLKAFAATCLIYLFLAAVLLFFGLERTIPADQEEGLFVNFGTVESSSGLFEPQTETAPKPTETQAVSPSVSEELITQDVEASVALENRKKEEVRKKVEAEKKQKASEIRLRTANVFARSSDETANQGSGTTGSGNQGVPTGQSSGSNTTGNGQGYGNFSLDGRSIEGALPRPSYTIQEEGVVVVQIVVNPRGNVVTAALHLQGTTTDNLGLRTAAVKAAKLARFNDITGSQNQSGLITYRFKLR